MLQNDKRLPTSTRLVWPVCSFMGSEKAARIYIEIAMVVLRPSDSGRVAVAKAYDRHIQKLTNLFGRAIEFGLDVSVIATTVDQGCP